MSKLGDGIIHNIIVRVIERHLTSASTNKLRIAFDRLSFVDSLQNSFDFVEHRSHFSCIHREHDQPKNQHKRFNRLNVFLG